MSKRARTFLRIVVGPIVIVLVAIAYVIFQSRNVIDKGKLFCGQVSRGDPVARVFELANESKVTHITYVSKDESVRKSFHRDKKWPRDGSELPTTDGTFTFVLSSKWTMMRSNCLIEVRKGTVESAKVILLD